MLHAKRSAKALLYITDPHVLSLSNIAIHVSNQTARRAQHAEAGWRSCHSPRHKTPCSYFIFSHNPQAVPNMLEIVPSGVNKWGGLQLLLDHLGLPPSALMAVGDGGNDLDMVAGAGVGVAMGNAVQVGGCRSGGGPRQRQGHGGGRRGGRGHGERRIGGLVAVQVGDRGGWAWPWRTPYRWA